MHTTRISIFTTALVFLMTACGGGGGGGGGDEQLPPLLNNACSVIGLNTRIINGTPCNESNSPVVRVIVVSSEGDFECSGSMITTKEVLTAAHCFLNLTNRRVFISAGGHTYPANAVTHPQAQIIGQGNDVKVINDAAVVHLSQTLSIPTLPILVSKPVEADDTISIFGYGLDENGGSDVLRSGQSRVSSVDEQHITAKYEGAGSNSCNGDSGGPALITITNNGQQQSGIVGLVSSGSLINCGIGDESLYSNLTTPSILNFVQSEAPGLNLL